MKFYTNVHVYKNTIRATIIDNGKRKHIKDSYSCDLFLPTDEETSFKTLSGDYVKKKNFASITEKKHFIEGCADVSNYDMYGDTENHFDYIRRFYNEGNYDVSHINTFNIDIEVESDEGFPKPDEAKWPINAITIKFKDKYYAWGTGQYSKHIDNVVYHQCPDEKELLSGVITFWQNNCPDIITGWNVKFFDIPYIINRTEKILGGKYVNLLSPWKGISERTVNIMGNDNQHYVIAGVAILDYLDLYKSFTYTKKESYKLDFIGFTELGMQKITSDDATEGYNLYKTDFQKFIEYNIRDTEIVDKLDKKLGLIQLVIELAYKAGINYEDVYSPVKMWECFIHKYLDENNTKVKIKNKHGKKTGAMVGAYVKDPASGFQNWVVSFDVNSLYPSLIRTLNIGPDTLRTYEGNGDPTLKLLKSNVNIDDLANNSLIKDEHKELLKEHELTLAANGVFFDNENQSFMSKLVEIMFTERISLKKEMLKLKQEYEKINGDGEDIMRELDDRIAMLNTKQMALKIALNSLYGAMGNAYFQFFSIECAEAITTTGQVTIKWVERKINEWMNKILKTKNKDYIIAVDTDSVYINASLLVEKLMPGKTESEIVEGLDRICIQIIGPHIENYFGELCEMLNVGEGFNWLKMGREVIATRGLWTAKKRYALNVLDDEGVRLKEPKLKVMGLESVRSSTPSAVRDKIKTALKIILTDTEEELQNFTKKFKEEFKKLDVEDIAFPKSVNGIEKYKSSTSTYKKGAPLHCRGSLIYNKLLEEKKLNKKYDIIRDGEKIKYTYLKEPNPSRGNVISIPQFLPKEFNLHGYVDYDMQFEKSYVQPLKTILDSVGWEIEKTSTLESFFE